MPLPKLFRRKKNIESEGDDELQAPTAATEDTSFVPPSPTTAADAAAAETTEPSTSKSLLPSFASRGAPPPSVQETYGLEQSKVNQVPPRASNDEESYHDHPTLPTNKSNKQESQPNHNQENDDYNLMLDADGEPVYVVAQKRGYLSIFFSVSQTLILIAMMIQCNIAPTNINPMFGPYPDALSYWGGKNAYYILYENEWWRLFSPIMLHAGVLHLLCNVAVQLDSGAFWEREWGSVTWLIIYLVSAAGGSCLSVIVIPNTVGVGSSGSVCGLFGAKLAEGIIRCRESRKSEQDKLSHDILCEQFGTTLCSVVLVLLFSFVPYVDWAAHVGGLLAGFTVGLMVFSFRVKALKWKCFWFMFGFTITFFGFAVSIVKMMDEVKDGVAEVRFCFVCILLLCVFMFDQPYY